MMYSSGKRICLRVILPGFLLELLLASLFASLTACSLRGIPVDKSIQIESPVSRPSEAQLLTDTRQRLLKWHDSTDRVYYGLKGPVKVLSVGRLSEDDPEVWEPSSAKRVLNFQRNGRISRITYRNVSDSGESGEFVVNYRYADNGLLQGYAWSVNGEKQRSVVFDYYPDGKMKAVQQKNHGNNTVSNTRYSYQMTDSGWFEIAKPVEAVDLPGYAQFQADGMLVWTSKGGVNNDSEALYYLPTRDQVTSSSIRQAYTGIMEGVGGYRYIHYPNGQLQSIESFSANNNELFHTTYYKFNKFGLLNSEVKRVTGSSIFNSVNNQAVDYRYKKIDEYGNWLERELRYTNGNQSDVIHQIRSLQYYID